MVEFDFRSISKQQDNMCIVNGAIMPLNEIENLGINEFGIQSKMNMPLKLYKYYSNIDTKNHDGIMTNYSQQSLKNNTVYLQTPALFDDVYDSDISLDYHEYEHLRLLEYCRRCGLEVNDNWTSQEAGDALIKALWPYYSQNDLEKAFSVTQESKLESLSNQFFCLAILSQCESVDNFGVAVSKAIAKEYQEYSEYLKKIFRIVCFTTTPYSQLMWGGSVFCKPFLQKVAK